jgi:hypothetical protein
VGRTLLSDAFELPVDLAFGLALAFVVAVGVAFAVGSPLLFLVEERRFSAA